jgi:hemerythrin-like metal-binding protein
LLAKNELPVLVVPSMNARHEEEIDIVNRLEALLADKLAGKGNMELLSGTLGELRDHIMGHFAHEEELMLAHNFPGYSIHRQEHEQAMAELDRVLAEWQSRGSTELVYNYVSRDFPAWFIQHASAMDRMTAHFIRSTAPPTQASNRNRPGT